MNRPRSWTGRHDLDCGAARLAGKVRAGFVPHLRRDVFKAPKPHHVDACPFVDLPQSKSSRWGGGVTADEMREMQWVKPELVAQIRFVEWTAEGGSGMRRFWGCAPTRPRERCGGNSSDLVRVTLIGLSLARGAVRGELVIVLVQGRGRCRASPWRNHSTVRACRQIHPFSRELGSG